MSQRTPTPRLEGEEHLTLKEREDSGIEFEKYVIGDVLYTLYPNIGSQLRECHEALSADEAEQDGISYVCYGCSRDDDAECVNGDLCDGDLGAFRGDLDTHRCDGCSHLYCRTGSLTKLRSHFTEKIRLIEEEIRQGWHDPFNS